MVRNSPGWLRPGGQTARAVVTRHAVVFVRLRTGLIERHYSIIEIDAVP